MAKNQDFEFEDFDFDNFGAEGDDGGFNGTAPKDDRSPVTKLSGSFVQGASNYIRDPSNQVKFIKQALPPGYSQAIGSVEKTVSNAKSLYDTALREAAPAIKEAKKITKVLLPSVKGVLPKGLSDKMEKWIEETGSGGSDFNPEENEITMSLGSIFSAYQEANKEQTEKAAAEQAARDYALAKQTGDSIKQLVGIHNYTGRLVAYQDQITSKYQQKSLELQYRHFFTAKKTLEILTQQLDLSKNSFEIIVKNTALPEVQKIHNSEIAKDMMKRKFLGKVTEPLSQWYGNVGQRVMMKARTDITTFFKDLGTQLSDYSGMISDADEQMRDMGGGSLGDFGLEMGSEMAGGAAMGKLSTYLAKKLGKSGLITPKMVAFGHFLERAQIEAPERLNQFLKEYSGMGGVRGGIADYVVSAAGKYQRSTLLQDNTSKDLEQKMYFDFQTRQTIVEVIPKWLSMIHNELEITRKIAGGTPAAIANKTEAKTWDWEESRIVEREHVKKKLSEKLSDKNDFERTNKDAREVMKLIDPGDEDPTTGIVTYGLSTNVRQKLFKHIIRLAHEGKTLSLELLVSPAALANPKLIGLTNLAEVEELQKYLKTENFGYEIEFDNPNKWNAEGTSVKGSWKNFYGTMGPFKKAKQSKLKKLSQRMSAVRANMKDNMGKMLEEIEKSSDHTQMLTELGYAKRDKDSYHINDEKVLDQYANYSNPDMPIFRAHGGTTKPNQNPLKALFQHFDGGGQPQKARRMMGQVRGPGTSTSDSIPAYVSDKEFIVRAESVGLPGVLPLLQFINSLGRKPEYAPHEMVGAGSDSTTASARLEQMVANNWQTTNDTLKQIITTLQEVGSKPIFTVNLPDLPNFDLSQIDFNKLKLSLGEAGVLKLYNSGKSALSWLGHNSVEFGKWTGKKAWELGKGAFNVATGVAKWGGGVAKSLWEGVDGFYVEGKNKLLLSIADLEIEDYIDVNTQKVIKKLSDITGEVRDSTGRVIISAEDYAKGIYYGKGRQIFAWISGARDKVWDAVKGVWRTAAIVPNAIKSTYNFMIDVLEAPDDVYVEGDNPWEPRLRAHLFKQNHYRVKSSGEIVKRNSQLVEPIVDIKGNEIINDEDLRRGLVDFNHQPIKGVRQKLRDFGVDTFNKALNIGKKIATTAQDVIFNLFGNIKNFFTGSSWGISLFSSTQTVVTRLEQIWHLLNKRLPGKKDKTPTDFGKHAKFGITVNSEMSKETKEQIKQTAEQVKQAAKETAKQAKQGSKAAKEAAKQIADKAKDSQPVQKAKTWWDEALENYDRRKQEWQDNQSYQNWLERNSSNNPTRQEDLDEEAYNQWLERSSAENPVREDQAISNKPSAMDNFKRLLNLEGKAQSIEQSKAMVLGYLKSKTLYQTIFENENLSESAKEAMMKRLEKARELLPNVPSLPADIKEKLQRLSKLADEERRPQSIKRYLDYVEEVAKKYGNKPKGGFGSWLSSLFGNKETEQQAPAPRIRSSDMEDLVNAQNSAEPENPTENNTPAPTQQNTPTNKKGFFGWLGSLFGKKTNQPTLQNIPPEVLTYLEDMNFPQEPKMNKLKRLLMGGYSATASNLASDRTRIADAFRQSSGLHDWGKGSLKDNVKGFFNWDMEHLFRSKESMDKIKQAKEEKLESKRQQKEWDTKYFQIYTQWQTGEISKEAHDAWLQQNPSPETIKKQAILDAKNAKAANKQKLKDENKQAKDKFMQDQKQWDMVHGQVYSQFAQGLMTKAEYEAWLEKNPSPKELRKEKLGKLSFKQRMGKIIKGDYTDRDGDGDRDGSAEDQRQQREEKKKNSLWEQFMSGYKEGKEKKITKEGAMSGLKSLFSGLMTVLGPFGKMIWGLKNILVGTVSAVARVAGFAVRAFNVLKGIPGLIGKGFGIAKNVAGAVINNPLTRGVLNVGGKVLGFGARILTGPVGWGLAALTAADYVTGGALSGTVGKGIDAVYDYFNAKSSVIAKYRMAQYGYDVDDETHTKKLIALEQLVSKNTTITSTGQAGFTQGLTAEEAMKIFGVDTKKEDQVNNWVEWFVKRFKPVYLAHATMMYNLTKKIDVPKADDIVPAKDKVNYLNGVHFTGDNNPYTIKASPFPSEDEVEITNGWFSDSVDDVYENVLRWAKDNAADAELAARRKRQEQNKKDANKPEPPDNSLWGKTKQNVKNSMNFVADSYKKATTEYNIIGTNLSLNEVGQYWGAKAFDAVQSAKQSYNNAKSDFKAWNGTTTPATGGWGKRPEGFDKMISAAAAKYGVPEHVLRTMAFIESKGVADAVANKGSVHEAVGIFQFTRAAAQDAGLIGPNGEDYRWDPQRNIEAGAFTLKKHMNEIRNKYGIEPTPALLYMMHQQGPGGFSHIMKALADPNNPKNDPRNVVLKTGTGPGAKTYTLQQSIDANAGKGASVQDFVKMWEKRYDAESAKANATYSANSSTPAVAATKGPGATPIPTNKQQTANTTVKPLITNANATSTATTALPAATSPVVTPVNYNAPVTSAGYKAPVVNTNTPDNFSVYAGDPKYIELGKKAYRLEAGVDFRLDPAFAQRIYAAFGEYFEKTKKMVTVTSCYRDSAKQADLYRAFLNRGKKPPLVAAPGKSKHEVGIAIDISSAQANEMEKMGILRKNGIVRPLLNHPRFPEPWHLEMATKTPTKPEESDTVNNISPVVGQAPTIIPVVTPVTNAPIQEPTQTEVKPITTVEYKPAVITNPADKMVVQSRDDEAQKKALAEVQQRAKALDSAKGIDGAVEILRQQHRLQEQMKDSLIDLGQTALRMEQVLLAMANNQNQQSQPQQPNVVRPNVKTVADSRPAPVSVSRQS